MFSFQERCWNTISVIEYSDSYDNPEFYNKFNMAISILTRRARNNDDSEFSLKEIAVLEYVFGIIEIYG